MAAGNKENTDVMHDAMMPDCFLIMVCCLFPLKLNRIILTKSWSEKSYDFIFMNSLVALKNLELTTISQ